MWGVALLVAGTLAVPAAAHPAGRFDLQAHRGGLGLRVENTLASFGNALQLGVSTLELDVQITEDGQAVVTHDRRVSTVKCADTAPVTAGDPEYPYAGKYVNTLTLAQVRTLDCGSRTLADRPGQLAVPGARMPLLREVFDLVKRYRADDVTLNVETKVEAGAPAETAPREQFVRVTAAEIRRAGLLRQVTIQSFDWGALRLMSRVEPLLPLVALSNYDFLQVGQPGASPWLGGLDIDDFGGDPIAAIRSFGATAYSPVHGFPQNGTVDDPAYRPHVTAAMVRHAHANGIKVVPWTVNDLPTLGKLIDDGVDGIITDYPDRLRSLLAQRGFMTPQRYGSPLDIQAEADSRPVAAQALRNPAVSTLVVGAGLTAEVLPLLRADTRLAVEVGSRREADRVIRELRRARGAAVRSSDLGILRHVHTVAPRIETVAVLPPTAAPDRLRAVDAVSPPASDYRGGGWHGLTVVPYGADDPATMQRLIDLGVDGIVTAVPDQLTGVAIRNGLR
jgi:glycerophosphoryl diester phosphodiesterase